MTAFNAFYDDIYFFLRKRPCFFLSFYSTRHEKAVNCILASLKFIYLHFSYIYINAHGLHDVRKSDGGDFLNNHKMYITLESK